MTSPIESSSSDEMDSAPPPKPTTATGYKSSASVSASDISDTDFAVHSEGEKGSTSEEADLEELERARAQLQVDLILASFYFDDWKGMDSQIS